MENFQYIQNLITELLSLINVMDNSRKDIINHLREDGYQISSDIEMHSAGLDKIRLSEIPDWFIM